MDDTRLANVKTVCFTSSRYVQCISFPRSGYGYFTRLVNAYFHMTNTSVQHCEYYSCCKQMPCAKLSKQLGSFSEECSEQTKNVFFAKNHDLDLIVSIPKEVKTVLIFSREPVAALASWKEQNDTLNISKSAIFYEKWMKKWLSFAEKSSNQSSIERFQVCPTVIVISYSDLIQRPCDVLQKCIENIIGKADPHLVARAVASQRKQCNREDVESGLKQSLQFTPRQLSANDKTFIDNEIRKSKANVFQFGKQFETLCYVKPFDKPTYKTCSMHEAERIVREMYKECFGRNVDPIGEAAYVPQVMQGLLREQDLRSVLKSSKEYKEKNKTAI